MLDHEGGINACVRELRRALDDDPRAPRYIETIPKRGYRLIPQPDSDSTDRPTARRARDRWRAVVAAGFVAVVLLAVPAIRGLTSPPTVIVLSPVPGTPARAAAALDRLVAAASSDVAAAGLRIITMRSGDVYDPRAGALRRGDTHFPADLVLEASTDDADPALLLYLHRASDGALRWMSRVPLDSPTHAAPDLARTLHSAT